MKNVFRVVLCMAVVLVGSGPLLAQETPGAGTNIVVGIDSLPGVSYTIVQDREYDTVGWVETTDKQKEEDFRATLITVRISRLRSVLLNEKLLAGFEVGASFTSGGTDVSWTIPANPDFDYTGTYETPLDDFGSPYTPNTNFSRQIERTFEASVFPVLGRLVYVNAGESMIFSFGIGIGAYVTHYVFSETETRTYVQDTGGPEKKGDVIADSSEGAFSTVMPGGEANLGISMPIMDDKMTIGLDARLGMTAKKKLDYDENTDYYSTDGTDNDDVLTTMKNGVELGGMSYGVGASIGLPF